MASAALAALAAWAFVPLAIRLALRTSFLDVPKGYKGHARATPYLGGAAVMGAFALAAVAFGGATSSFAVILVGALVLFALGTVDDRVLLGPGIRLVAEVAAAAVLWRAGLGWEVWGDETANLLLTIVWVVGIVNAFNLMDNMDGAAATVAATSAMGIGAIALLQGDAALAALVFAVAGACAGFLRFNLASPARIFLGDGGSMPLGFILAAAVMALPLEGGLGWAALLVAAPLVGLPILDTTMVCISRARRDVQILAGGRDHLTHRLRERLGTPQAVALTLAIAQAGLCALAVSLSAAPRAWVIAVAMVYVSVGAAAIYVLDLSWQAPEAASEPASSALPLPEAVAAAAPVAVAAAGAVSAPLLVAEDQAAVA